MPYTTEQVSAALNAAADSVLVAIEAPDEGVRDAINLVVNATMTMLDHPDASLEDVVASNYGDVTLGEIKDWCAR